MGNTNTKYRDGVNALIAGAQALGVNNASRLVTDGIVGKELLNALDVLRNQGRTDDNKRMMQKVRAVCRDVGESCAAHRLLSDCLGPAAERFVTWLGEQAVAEAAAAKKETAI